MGKTLNELNAVVSTTGSDILLIQQAGDDMKITLGDIRDLVLESVFPVGSVYTQLPTKQDPAGLGYPGVWENVSTEFAGDFFRVEGGNALAFEAGEQADENKSHLHTMSFRIEGGSNSGYSGLDTTGTGYLSTYPDTGLSGGDESRPINQTTRVWERTS